MKRSCRERFVEIVSSVLQPEKHWHEKYMESLERFEGHAEQASLRKFSQLHAKAPARGDHVVWRSLAADWGLPRADLATIKRTCSERFIEIVKGNLSEDPSSAAAGNSVGGSLGTGHSRVRQETRKRAAVAITTDIVPPHKKMRGSVLDMLATPSFGVSDKARDGQNEGRTSSPPAVVQAMPEPSNVLDFAGGAVLLMYPGRDVQRKLLVPRVTADHLLKRNLVEAVQAVQDVEGAEGKWHYWWRSDVLVECQWQALLQALPPGRGQRDVLTRRMHAGAVAVAAAVVSPCTDSLELSKRGQQCENTSQDKSDGATSLHPSKKLRTRSFAGWNGVKWQQRSVHQAAFGQCGQVFARSRVCARSHCAMRSGPGCHCTNRRCAILVDKKCL